MTPAHTAPARLGMHCAPSLRWTMSRWHVYTMLIVMIPGACVAWWWKYGPEYQRQRGLVEAENAMAAQQYYRAETLLKQLVTAFPGDARLHLLRAQALRHLDRFTDADFHLGRAAELGLSREEGRREFGLLYSSRNFALAQGALEQELKAHPSDTEVMHALAVGLAVNKRWSEAEQLFRRLLELQPEDLEARLNYARMHFEAENFGKAIPLYREVLAAAPHNFRARILLCHCLLADARMNEAETELLVCREMRPESPDPLIGLAQVARERGDSAKAITLLSRAYELDAGSLLAVTELGNLQMANNRYDLAIHWFTKALAIDNKDKQSHLKMAQALRYQGQLERALEHEQIYQQLDRDDEARQRQRRLTRY